MAGRILPDRDWPHYNGYNVAFRPARMSPDELLGAHRKLWNRAFRPQAVSQRLVRAAQRLRPGGLMLATVMNSFYGLKRVSGNTPKVIQPGSEHQIAHPSPHLGPFHLAG